MSASIGPPATDAARALMLHARDNVATALCAMDAGTRVQATGPQAGAAPVVLREPIALCHKFALRDIARGEIVVKYGEPIGLATQDIGAGEHVHTHNIASARAR